MALNAPVLFAQDTKTLIHEGDELYRQKKYKEAEEAYRKAAAKKDEKLESNFNLGDALYREKKLDSADRNFAAIAASSTNPLIKAEAYHNLGNSLLTAKKYDRSIDAYKKALMNNPQDDQTRYNLAYAEEMSKKNPPPPPPKNNNNSNNNNKNNNNKNNSDKNKNDKDKNNKDKNKSDKDKSNSDKSKSDQDKGNPGGNGQHGQPPPPPGVSKEDAQRMLDALNEQEKGTQQKLSAKKVKAVRVPVIKDW